MNCPNCVEEMNRLIEASRTNYWCSYCGALSQQNNNIYTTAIPINVQILNKEKEKLAKNKNKKKKNRFEDILK